MEPSIIVQIPERCYISPDPKRVFPFPFSFVVTYGYLPEKSIKKFSVNREKGIRTPQITISGFEQLLLEEHIKEFLENLKLEGGDDWAIEKGTDSKIRMKYVGEALGTDFYFRASTEKFIADIKRNDVVTLQVKVSNFDGVPDQIYMIGTKVDYTPWAKQLEPAASVVELGSKVEINYICEGDHIDKILMQNGKIVDTARTPYCAIIEEPSLFTLEVMNHNGVQDWKQCFVDVSPPEIRDFRSDRIYFAPGESVELNWSLFSVSNVSLEPIREGKDQISQENAIVYPVANSAEETVVYRLMANGFRGRKPGADLKELVLIRTGWKKKGGVSGFFAGDVYADLHLDSPIFYFQGTYYYYAHPNLYKSGDCLTWCQMSTNDKADDSFLPIAAGFDSPMLYTMGKEGKSGSELFVCQYDFLTSKWEYGPAYQLANSQKGRFAFSKKKKEYAQIITGGILVVRQGEEGRWNGGTSVIRSYEEEKVIDGDYCFFKDRNYAVMLCESHRLFVYDCSDSMEEVLFVKNVGKSTQFVRFIKTVNSLYLILENQIMEVITQKTTDPFCPPFQSEKNRPWLGVDCDNHIIGIFPDKNLWILNHD